MSDEREWTISVGPRTFGGQGQAQGGHTCIGEVVVPKFRLEEAERGLKEALDVIEAKRNSRNVEILDPPLEAILRKHGRL